MEQAWDFDRCVGNFNQEIALLRKISGVQDSVRQAVMAREWADFDWKMAEVNQLGEEFKLLEAERLEILASLRDKFHSEFSVEKEEEPSFYSLAVKLPQNQCRELSGLFRELKMETLKLRAQNETFTGYLSEIKTVAAAWLEAIFPAQGGKLYNRKGVEALGALRSMVFNHRA